MTATRLTDQRSSSLPPADFEGNQQRLPGGGSFLGWGQQPYFAEFDSHGQPVLEGRFVPATAHYRAYLLPWTGTPDTRPAVSATASGASSTVYASWNGATNVKSWRVLTGERADTLGPVVTAVKDGFETVIQASTKRYVAVQALDASGHVLATSATVQSR